INVFHVSKIFADVLYYKKRDTPCRKKTIPRQNDPNLSTRILIFRTRVVETSQQRIYICHLSSLFFKTKSVIGHKDEEFSQSVEECVRCISSTSGY
ncbi:unnamed protein product, partial [Amoebophrya sp. A25]